jgi:hypothetical protein
MSTATEPKSDTAGETFEIVAVDVRNHRRIERVTLDLTGHRHFLLIAGNNGAGKTTLLDSLPAALGGAGEIADDPIRRGSKRADIAIKLRGTVSGDEYTATRSIVTGKAPALKLVGPHGKIEPAQTWLDDLLAGRTLDPATFLLRATKDQRAVLLTLLGLDTTEIDADHARAFGRRTEVNRALKEARAQLAGVPEPERLPPAARAADAIAAELDQVDVERRTRDDRHAARARIVAGLETLEERQRERREAIAKLQAELAAGEDRAARGRADLETATAALAECRPLEELTAKRADLAAEQSRASAYAIAVARNEERARTTARLEATIEARATEADELTAKIDDAKDRKIRLLTSKPMPVEGLGVDEDGLTLAGEAGPVPFDQASHAQRLRCAIAIAMLQAGRLRDVWLRDGSLLDAEGLVAVRELAERFDRRVWLEVVGERRDTPDVIVIRAGKVLELEAGA